MKSTLLAALASSSVSLVATASPTLPASPPQKFYAYALDPVALGACTPTGINDSGVVIGVNITNPPGGDSTLAFITGPNGMGVKALSFGGQPSVAAGVNSSGRVVGNAVFPDDPLSGGGFITDANGDNMRPFHPDLLLGLYGINDSGMVIGTYSKPGHLKPFITDPEGLHIHFLAVLGSYARPAAINSKGQVVGFTSVEGMGGMRAFVTGPNGKGLRDLGLPERYNAATGINDLGQVTGTTFEFGDYSPGDRKQFVTDANGFNPRNLPSLRGAPDADNEGSQINNGGVAVGRGTKRYSYGHELATIASANGEIRNLDRFVVNLPENVRLTGGAVINNVNQVAAAGSDGKCYIVCPKENCQK